MININPSIITSNLLNIDSTLKVFVKNNIKWLHFDVMDGNFVDHITFGDKLCKDVVTNFPELNVEVHLMVKETFKQIDNFIKAGAKRIFFHFETLSYRECQKAIDEIKFKKLQAGITWKPSTNTEQIYEYLEFVDAVLIMGVEPGKGGQGMIEGTIEKIAKLKAYRDLKGYKFKILFDGGVKKENVKQVIAAGADEVIIGSALFDNNLVSEAKIKEIQNL